MSTNTIESALAGFEALIQAQVDARVEAVLATERAEMQKRTDNAVQAALADIRTYIVQAVGLLEACVK